MAISYSSTKYELNGKRSPFSETRAYLLNYIDYTSPLSFDEWVIVDDSSKAAVLYLQFYEQITLAWYKAKSNYGDENLGVSTILQYLEKNVPIIKGDPKRFTANYIYRVAYNCLYCICHDIQRDKQAYQNEISATMKDSEDKEINILLTIEDVSSDPEKHIRQREFWKQVEIAIAPLIQKYGDRGYEYLRRILSGEPLPCRYHIDSDSILDNLRSRLEIFRDEY